LSTPTPQIEGRTGIQQEQKKKVNGNEQKQRSSVSPFVSKPETSGETPEPPDERFEWAKKHKFWSKFTTNPKSFKTGCLDSEEFNQQFRERKQKTASRSTNPAHAGGGFLTPNPPCKNGCGRISHSVGLCWECQSEASAAKKEAENGNSALSGKKIHFASRVPSSLPNAPNGNDHEGSGFLAAKIAAQNGTAASKTPQSEGKSNSTKTTLPVASTSQRGKVPPSITTPQPCYEHGVGACNDVMWVPGCARCEAVKNFVEQYQIEKNPACHGGQDRAKEVPVPGKNISLDEL